MGVDMCGLPPLYARMLTGLILCRYCSATTVPVQLFVISHEEHTVLLLSSLAFAYYNISDPYSTLVPKPWGEMWYRFHIYGWVLHWPIFSIFWLVMRLVLTIQISLWVVLICISLMIKDVEHFFQVLKRNIFSPVSSRNDPNSINFWYKVSWAWMALSVLSSQILHSPEFLTTL
jgi:hypothetical protein